MADEPFRLFFRQPSPGCLVSDAKDDKRIPGRQAIRKTVSNLIGHFIGMDEPYAVKLQMRAIQK